MKIDRLMAITMYLLNRGVVSAAALAKRFEVSKRTIQRDIEALNQAGIPILSYYGSGGGYEIMDGFKLTKQIAGADDYLNIIIALKGLSSAYDNGKINTTLEKALATMQAGEQRVFVDFAAARERKRIDEYLNIIDGAVTAKTPLCIEYTDAGGIISKRIIEPLALSYQWYAWYLFAYCTTRQNYRLFKIVRITSCNPTAECFSKQHGNIEQLMKTALSHNKQNPFYIRLLCKSAVRQQVIEYLGDNIIEELKNGDFILQMNAVPFERMWFSLIMGFGNQVEVLEPVDLRVMLRQRAEEILELY